MYRAESQHIVTSYRDEGLADGTFRPCAHLYIFKAVPPYKPYFFMACSEASFAADQYWDTYDGVRAWENPKCPADCKHFKDKAAAEREERAAKRKQATKGFLLAVPRALMRFFLWFAAASWQVQIAIVLSLILLFAPRWATPLIEIIRAIQGK